MKLMKIAALFLTLWVTPLSLATPISMNVVTFNAGFLDTKILGVKRIFVPEYALRLSALPFELGKYLKDDPPSIIAFQEFWNPDAMSIVRTTMEQNGYSCLMDEDFPSHGLELCFDAKIFSLEEKTFTPIKRATFEKLAGYKRGLLWARMRLQNGKTMSVATAHLTPTIGMTSVRREQVDDISTWVSAQSGTSDFIVVAADLNISPEFAFTLNRKKEGSEKDWKENAELFGRLLTSSGLRDSYREANSQGGFTQNRLVNQLASYSPSTQFEPEQRIDHVLYKATNDNYVCKTKASRLIFTEALKNSHGADLTSTGNDDLPVNEKVWLSDHFGVQSQIECAD